MTNATRVRPVPPETSAAGAARAALGGVGAFVLGAALMAGAILLLASLNLVDEPWMHFLTAPVAVALASGAGRFGRAAVVGALLGVGAVTAVLYWFLYLLEW